MTHHGSGASCRTKDLARNSFRQAGRTGHVPEYGGADLGGIRGKHRAYSEADVERIREIIRLRDLLGLSLDQLAVLLDAETARAALRRELEHEADPDRIRGILEQALGHIGTQLELVRMRRQALGQLEEELVAKRRRIHKRLSELPEE